MPAKSPAPPVPTGTADASPPAPTTPADGATPADDAPPKWLDETYLQTLLAKELKVSSLNIERAVPVGENYATIVFRAQAATTLGPVSLILKCVPEAEFRAKMVREAEFAIREVRMYEHTLPLLRGALARPQYPYCYSTERETLVLQDMRPFGYRTRQRQLGMDLDHCRIALKELAHLHGLSVALRIQHPEVFKREIIDLYHDVMFASADRMEMNRAMMKPILKSLATAARDNFPFRFHGLSEIMDHMSENAVTEVFNCLTYPEDPKQMEEKIMVLNHGDFWSNNMLFKYTEHEKPEECMLIDFQISRCAPPVLDLLYFFYSSTDKALRHNHMNELLELYLKETRAAMATRGVQHPPVNRFYKDVAHVREDMKKNLAFGFVWGCMVMPIVVADSKDAPDLDTMDEETIMSGEASMFESLYRGPRFCKLFREMLEDYDDMGFFSDFVKKYPLNNSS